MAEVEIYTFACGLQVWRYTDALLPVSYLGSTYAAAVIKRGAIEQSTDLEKATLTITVPVTLGLMDLFRPAPPLRRIYVTVQRLTRGDTTARTLWSGTVGSPDSGQHTATLTCMSRAAAQQNTGLRRKWTKTCGFALYSPAPMCAVDRTAFRVNGTLSYASGNMIKSGAFANKPDGYFAGGFIEWTSNGDEAWRFVIAHVGDTLTLLTASPLVVGGVVQAYPGCNHSYGPNGCGRFNNLSNYGGQPYIPSKNPFGANNIF